MKTLKKVLVVVLALTMAIASMACGTKKEEEKTTYTVGICQLVQHVALDAATQGFKDALTEAMTKAGKTVVFDEQNAQGDSNTCTTIVNSFVSKNVDLIMANATAALQAAYSGTTTIPVLGTSITEYGVALGISNFSGTVGGNVSGTSDLAPLETQAQMMVDLLPNANKIGILYCSAEANSLYQANVIKAALEKSGKTVTVYTFSDSNDLATVATKAAATEDAIYVPTDNTVASNAAIVDQICSEKNVPVFAGEEGICEGCGFATLSISYYDLGVKTGEMAAKILLEGADISTMAVAYSDNPTKKYVASRCEKLGIVIPSDYEEIK